jgi:hypothetical protein
MEKGAILRALEHRMKQVTVCMLESGKLVDRTIAPGTTAADLLRDVGLPNGLLSTSRDGDFFANADTVYEKITDGQKLFASTPASVGSSLLDTISTAIERIEEKYFPKPSQTHTFTGGVGRRPAPLVGRREIPYWQERGWKRRGQTYEGRYVTPFGAFTGSISQQSSTDIQFYIQHPPDCIFNSSHATCFQPRSKGWFFVHMSTRPKDVSSGIVTIERLLTDCFRIGGRYAS